jgi:hypothetical protein
MQAQVPQFIETESKIIWNFTLGQFFYATLTLLISFGLYKILNLAVALPLIVLLLGSAVAIAVVKVNGRPITAFLQASFGYFWGNRYFSFKLVAPVRPVTVPVVPATKPMAKESPLKNIFRLITTSTSPIAKREASFSPGLSREQAAARERYEILKKITGEKEVAKRIDYS